MADDELTVVYRAGDSVEAHMVANILDEAGLPATVDGEYLSNVLGGVPFGWATSPRVLVFKKDAVAALELIQSIHSPDDGPLPDDFDPGPPVE